ncbi:f3.3 [Tranosema rostrale ichnovirus]|nr:f3.3 [Tranosema rostrale ichnovirus]
MLNTRERKTSRASPSPPVCASKEIVLPVDIILYMVKFLCVADFRSFIRSLWPNNDEDDTIRKKMWQLSTNSIATIFINEKQLEVVYNFDPSRIEEDRILISVNSLLPLFGGIVPPAMDDFTSVSKLSNFVEQYVSNTCSDYQHASCRCHLLDNDGRGGERFVAPPVDTCDYGHFHHYCSQHVMYWFTLCLVNSIHLRENGKIADEEGEENLRLFLNHCSFGSLKRALVMDSTV